MKLKRKYYFYWLLVFSTGYRRVRSGKDRSPVQERLKLGVLPLEDILPMIVANEKGYFAEENLEVELVTLQSAVESQSAIQSGEIDGMMTDMIVAALLKMQARI